MTSHSRRDILRMASGLAAASVASSMVAFQALAAGGEAALAGGVPTFLTGHFHPVNAETDAVSLPMRGSIPGALSGRYFRNGHNPR